MLSKTKFLTLSEEERTLAIPLMKALGIPIPDIDKDKRDRIRSVSNRTKSTTPLASYVLHITITCRLCHTPREHVYIMIPDKIKGAHILRSTTQAQLKYKEFPLVKTKKTIATCKHCLEELLKHPAENLASALLKLHKEYQI
ncbi:MAG: hypothetical protein JRJ00_14765 [Deltaproteobacteria bacterium]|nr:hypothetical protein [Deltaproteobacteria bacterium]